eukprot:scaffold10196_cov129-Isochrysis_galbana.AAC.7
MVWAQSRDNASWQTRSTTASWHHPGLDCAASLTWFTWPLILACLAQPIGASSLTGTEVIPTKMRGAVLPGNSHVDMLDFEVPKPGHGEVRAYRGSLASVPMRRS